MKNENDNSNFKLKKGEKRTPFDVPKGYFDNFADNLIAKIEAENKNKRSKKIFIILKTTLSIAASIALVLWFSFSQTSKTDKPQLLVNKIDTSIVKDNEIDNYFSNFNETQFLLAFSEVEEKNEKSISTDELGEYLAANCSDYEIVKLQY